MSNQSQRDKCYRNVFTRLDIVSCSLKYAEDSLANYASLLPLCYPAWFTTISIGKAINKLLSFN